MDKKKLIVLGLLVLLIAAVYVIYVMQSQPQKTPEEVIRGAYKDSATHLQVQDILKELDVDQGKLVLYRNVKGNGMLTYLEASGKSWEIKDILGEQPLQCDVNPVGEFFSVNRKDDIYIGFGIIYDPALSAVSVDGHEATMVQGDVPFWYYISDTEFEQNVMVEWK